MVSGLNKDSVMKCFLAFWLVFVSFFSVGLHANDAVLQQAYQSQQSDLQVQGFGQVVKVLPDDNDGSKHQKFILKLNSGQTLLVAHNIDLAPRIPNLKVGDSVEFYGEYEWNKKGGVLHWTHKDPQNRHAHGWLKHNGQVYE
ncbi:TPA: DUF3465 domain-containing protein [Vibrio cholerae]|uniref:DUF3465 domain-containing protein n=36 Tax=Vibrio cholerae TaxID=666 RepID=A0A7X3JP29_VIBCL|nr:hypothetical protein VCM66_A0409 [Vibrio cholerae M66-2]ACP11279.1 hypothetical protein VC395_A0442 [Vibrio cholerae O395]AFC59943.1 hypothetical protein O3Y_15623 [Vibrio cholerae IEC224]ARB79713.1 DUF3465 domain-containing protein [Vibrio cholerae]AVH53614.1 DUF3465 domain-containing protein [Vibrio cholerae O1 biovar El Tor]EET23745.1 conserved hypothetical protein [Vibrio cholerae MO10]EFH77281.1 conserved hypothetical protein [Vibrio cholerae MAK 757]OWH58283.1 hypothetical protein C